MGYTHYFEQKKPVNKEDWKKIKEDSIKILDYINKYFSHISLCTDDPTDYIVNDHRINLNDSKNGHETFYLPRHESGFQFCKTAHKPYDLAVCALLLIADHYAPNYYDISSDGTSFDWQDAANLNAKVLGYAFKIPKNLKDEDSESIENEAQTIAQAFKNQKTEEVDNNIGENSNNRFKF